MEALTKNKKNFTSKNPTKITTNKILNKYKTMERPKKTYLVNEEELETTNYDEP